MAKSKQAQAKIDQGYQRKPVHNLCRNCLYYSFETPSEKEANVRCTKGGFATIRTATCDKHAPKE